MNIIEGSLSAANFKFAIIISRFNEAISSKLLEGAVDCLKRHNCRPENIDVIKVPGAFEIPVTADKAASSKKYEAVICLGAVIKGATPHFEYVASSTSNGIMQASFKNSVPVIFGVLTTDNIEQAIERAGTKSGNKGWDAALTAIEMADLFKRL
ncbi:MAG: 6,7-dimethyl-8-ribityllumazine synthase [Ignavibacterium sp.]|nr:6,7-dimethyl-8-ribityllumazine synthase [Ignavibacterium sp.]